MLAPILFNDTFDFLDPFCNDLFGFDESSLKNAEKKLYGHRAKNVMNTDIKEHDEGYELMVDLPGFTKNEVSVDLENGYLVITAQKSLDSDSEKNKNEHKNEKYLRRERYSGSASRSFYIGEDITHNDVKAKFEHGILTIDIPKKDPAVINQKKAIQIEG